MNKKPFRLRSHGSSYKMIGSSPLQNGDGILDKIWSGTKKGAGAVWKGAKWVYKKNPLWVGASIALDDRDVDLTQKTVDAIDDHYLFGGGSWLYKKMQENKDHKKKVDKARFKRATGFDPFTPKW